MYKKNLSSVNKLVLIKFAYDFVVVPNDSSWFFWGWAGGVIFLLYNIVNFIDVVDHVCKHFF